MQESLNFDSATEEGDQVELGGEPKTEDRVSIVSPQGHGLEVKIIRNGEKHTRYQLFVVSIQELSNIDGPTEEDYQVELCGETKREVHVSVMSSQSQDVEGEKGHKEDHVSAPTLDRDSAIESSVDGGDLAESSVDGDDGTVVQFL